MRFSIRWVLAGTVYVAFAAAAFGTGKWYFADLLWAFSLLAPVLAAVVSVYSRGVRQAGTLGLVMASAVFFVASTFDENEFVPTVRIMRAFGLRSYYLEESASSAVAPPFPLPATRVPPPEPLDVDIDGDKPDRLPLDFATGVRAGHAVLAMLIGITGLSLGILGFHVAKGRGLQKAGDAISG
jgi:hypothetical protein